MRSSIFMLCVCSIRHFVGDWWICIDFWSGSRQCWLTFVFFLIQLGFWLEKWEVGWRRMRGMRELYGIYWNFLRIGGVLTAIVWYCVHLFLPFCRILYSVRSISYLILILIYLNFSILEVCSFFILIIWLSMPQLDFNFKIWKRLKRYI